MNQEEFNEILELHRKYLNNEPGGECADFSFVDLRDVIFNDSDLRGVKFMDSDLSCADFSDAKFLMQNF